jgi:hypothetical protein
MFLNLYNKILVAMNFVQKKKYRTILFNSISFRQKILIQVSDRNAL